MFNIIDSPIHLREELMMSARMKAIRNSSLKESVEKSKPQYQGQLDHVKLL